MLMTRHIGTWALSTTVLILCLLGVCLLSGCPGARPTAGDTDAAPSRDREEPAVDYDNTMVEHDEGIVAVTNSSFEEVVLGSEMPVLVDFWASWCGPCQMVHPVLEQIASKYNGKVLIAKVDVDASGNQQLADKYGVRGIPALFLIKNGEVVDEWVGYDDSLAQTLSAAIEKTIEQK